MQPAIVGRQCDAFEILPFRLAILARCTAEQQPVSYVVEFVEPATAANLARFKQQAMPAHHSQTQPSLLGYNEFRLFPLQISLFELSHHL